MAQPKNPDLISISPILTKKQVKFLDKEVTQRKKKEIGINRSSVLREIVERYILKRKGK